MRVGVLRSGIRNLIINLIMHHSNACDLPVASPKEEGGSQPPPNQSPQSVLFLGAKKEKRSYGADLHSESHD